MSLFFAIFVSYLIGAVPTAYIFGKLYKKIDIRKHGSGNVGATNVFRVLGKWPGIIVLVLDIIKGIIPVWLIADVFSVTLPLERIVLAVSAVCGHNWTIFLGFKGGKGIATSLGALIGLTIVIESIRFVLLLTVFTWLLCFLLSGFVSLSSIFASILLPGFMIITDQDFELVLLGIVFCAFVVIRHKSNIKRLLSGREPKVSLPFFKKNN
ncbi:MAG: glycerol-3-phosphate 1-O-acyltransferase PlsY [Candidatus Omnitrophica bacterium]|nr:glycerol-3-phosphate 1-O-acyltransferase PlsY [Candidatus Omnitrophota bacterium]